MANVPSFTARLLQFGLCGEGFANSYLPYGSSQDTPLRTGHCLSFPALVKQQVWNKLGRITSGTSAMHNYLPEDNDNYAFILNKEWRWMHFVQP